ncbi:MAG TPA: ABC transporter permease [Vicinamibacterales bacterium]|nr:ABC transporter permease [Vicinamibacterales bacterium]
MLEALKQDIRSACRGLWRAKAFASAATLTLALGITGTTVMFAVVDGVLLRPLPVRDQDRLVLAWKELRSSRFAHYPFGGPDVDAVVEASQLLESGAGVTSNGAVPWVVVEDGSASYVPGALVTGAYFEVLGIHPLLGRALTRTDDVAGADNVVVISYALWKRRYGGSRDTIGRRIVLGGTAFTIVGVMPPALDYPNGVEIWRTVRSVPAGGVFGDAAHYEIDLIGRLRPGVTIDQAAAELASIAKRIEANAPPDRPRDVAVVVRSFEDVIVGDSRPAMLALFGAVALVLLIATANVANLLLLRGEVRSGELAVRAALGAGGGRILSLIFAESLTLATAAGAAALVTSWWSLEALVRLIPEELPRGDDSRIDVRVLAFAMGIVFLAALAACIVPALASVRRDLVAQLQNRQRGRGGVLGRRALVAAQVGLAVMIVAGAGLLTRSLLKLQAIDLGLAADRLVFMDFVPSPKFRDPAHHSHFLDEIVARLESTSAIATATPVNVLPFSGLGGWDVPRFTAAGQTETEAAANPSLNLESIHPNYFETFQIRLLRGRSFTDADREGAVNVAIVSEDVAARTWPGGDPIGQRLKMGGPGSKEPWLTVVGVAGPTRYRELATARATLYLPAKQFLNTARMLVVRSTASPTLIASLSREHVRAVDPDVQIIRVVPFARFLDAPLARPRFNVWLIGIFAIAASVLASVGLYAVVAAFVRQHDREIGIRMALGATGANVRNLVLTEAARLAGPGAAAGLIGALFTTRLVRGMLFEVDPLDAPTLAGAAVLLILASLLAAYVPTRRARRLDAAAMLRSQ